MASAKEPSPKALRSESIARSSTATDCSLSTARILDMYISKPYHNTYYDAYSLGLNLSVLANFNLGVMQDDVGCEALGSQSWSRRCR